MKCLYNTDKKQNMRKIHNFLQRKTILKNFIIYYEMVNEPLTSNVAKSKYLMVNLSSVDTVQVGRIITQKKR